MLEQSTRAWIILNTYINWLNFVLPVEDKLVCWLISFDIPVWECTDVFQIDNCNYILYILLEVN